MENCFVIDFLEHWLWQVRVLFKACRMFKIIFRMVLRPFYSISVFRSRFFYFLNTLYNLPHNIHLFRLLLSRRRDFLIKNSVSLICWCSFVSPYFWAMLYILLKIIFSMKSITFLHLLTAILSLIYDFKKIRHLS